MAYKGSGREASWIFNFKTTWHEDGLLVLCFMRANVILGSNNIWKPNISSTIYRNRTVPICMMRIHGGQCNIGTILWFLTLHFQIPFVIATIAIVHLLFLHQTGFYNPLGLKRDTDKILFHLYFTTKDPWEISRISGMICWRRNSQHSCLESNSCHSKCSPTLTDQNIPIKWLAFMLHI